MRLAAVLAAGLVFFGLTPAAEKITNGVRVNPADWSLTVPVGFMDGNPAGGFGFQYRCPNRVQVGVTAMAVRTDEQAVTLPVSYRRSLWPLPATVSGFAPAENHALVFATVSIPLK